MKFPKLLETLTREPLLMTPGAVESILTMFEQHANLSAADFKLAREGTGQCGEAVTLEKMTIKDGIASIPINGPLGVRLGSFEKGAGAVDYLDIMEDLRKAQDDPEVHSIVLHFDTPGGSFAGLPETADLIASSDKPVYSYVPAGGMCCSAGMWLAAATDGIFASLSAQVGSIGVYCAYTDMSEMAAKRGIKVKMFSSGKYKGMGVPGTTLTEEQEEYLQDSVMGMAEEFYEHMRNSRGAVPDEAMQGQSFRAQDALRNGLIDDIIKTEEELLSFLR
jgi:signal peptide peptidase SppA